MMNYDKLFDDKFTYQIKEKDCEKFKEYLLKKKGWVYIAFSQNNNLLKIGRTGKNPLERAKTLSTVGVLHDYEILFALPVFNQFMIEAKVHQKLKKFCVSKEFFSVKEDIAIATLKKEYEREIQLLDKVIDTNMILEDIELLPYALK